MCWFRGVGGRSYRMGRYRGVGRERGISRKRRWGVCRGW